jgi:hypothetical protein
VRTASAAGRLVAQDLLLSTPEFLVRVMEVILRRLKCLGRHRRGNPTTSDRLNHRERFQSVRGIPQALMNSMKPLALLLRELLWLTFRLHVSPSQLPVPGGSEP